MSEERTFSSGAKRDSNENKPFIHMISAYFRQRLGYLFNLGAKKYGNENFLKGIPTDVYLESIHRHLALYEEDDRTEDHISAIGFGLNGIMLNEKKEGIPSDYYFKIKNGIIVPYKDKKDE